MGRCDIKMTPTNREKLSWVRGMIMGITVSMGEGDEERRDALRAVARVIESMLYDDEEEDHETQTD